MSPCVPGVVGTHLTPYVYHLLPRKLQYLMYTYMPEFDQKESFSREETNLSFACISII